MLDLNRLSGYFAMTLSPLEGVNLATVGALGFIRSQLHVIVPGLVSGPIFGWLGYQWRTSRSWLSAALVAGAFCLEPPARTGYGQPFQFAGVAAGEILFGLVVATYFARIGLKGRRQARPH